MALTEEQLELIAGIASGFALLCFIAVCILFDLLTRRHGDLQTALWTLQANHNDLYTKLKGQNEKFQNVGRIIDDNVSRIKLLEDKYFEYTLKQRTWACDRCDDRPRIRKSFKSLSDEIKEGTTKTSGSVYSYRYVNGRGAGV